MAAPKDETKPLLTIKDGEIRLSLEYAATMIAMMIWWRGRAKTRPVPTLYEPLFQTQPPIPHDALTRDADLLARHIDIDEEAIQFLIHQRKKPKHAATPTTTPVRPDAGAHQSRRPHRTTQR